LRDKKSLNGGTPKYFCAPQKFRRITPDIFGYTGLKKAHTNPGKTRDSLIVTRNIQLRKKRAKIQKVIGRIRGAEK